MSEPNTEAQEWTQIESLKGTRLGALLVDYREQLDTLKDATKRIEALRELIAPLISQSSIPAKASVARLQATWVGAGKTSKLVPALLVQAGVTGEQIKAGTKESPKKAYLLITELDPTAEPSSSPEPSNG